MLQSFGGREVEQWASEAWFRGGGRFAVGQANTASSTPHARDKSQTKSQTKTQPKTPSKPQRKKKTGYGTRYGTCYRARTETASAQGSRYRAAKAQFGGALSLLFAGLAGLAAHYSLAPSLTRFPAVSCASSCKPLAR